jgi:hypothetical protein
MAMRTGLNKSEVQMVLQETIFLTLNSLMSIFWPKTSNLRPRCGITIKMQANCSTLPFLEIGCTCGVGFA